MKSSTKKIIGISGGALALMVLVDSFAPKGTLQSYLQAMVATIAVISSVALMGWAKPRSSERKLASIVFVLVAALYQIAFFVLLGMKLGFLVNVYKWNFASISQVFLPLIANIVLLEILRGQLVEKGRSSRVAVYVATALIFLIQVAIVLPAYTPLNAANWFSLITTVVLPAALTNILLTYIAYYYDYRANIAYRLIMELPIYLLPISPDVNQYLSALFLVIFVVIVIAGYVCVTKWNERNITKATAKYKKRERRSNDQQERLLKFAKQIGIGAGVLVMVAYVALMSGLFKYHFLAIGSGSMEPSIYRGDLILVEKTNHYASIKPGDVLVYQRKNMVVVHRVSEVEVNGQSLRFHTKGDANSSEDGWQVDQKDVIGVAKGKIAALGYPTLWLSKILNNNGE